MVRIDYRDQVVWNEHRSGWKYALESLHELHSEDGAIFNGSIDASFGYAADRFIEAGTLPYTSPWIGFIHGTIAVCPWATDDVKPIDAIFSSKIFEESAGNCRGIFTLSRYVAEYVSEKVNRFNIPVGSVKHPTEFPLRVFSYQEFLDTRRILHAGTWMRRITSFFDLDVSGLDKMLLLNSYTLRYIQQELQYVGKSPSEVRNVQVVNHVSNSMYDDLLCSSIVFNDLYDSNANNVVIECIARNTPILVNKIPAATEYLGDDYPFYYSSLEEANSKAQDDKLVAQTSEYLRTFPSRNDLQTETFVRSLKESAIVRLARNGSSIPI
jgi:hypothetical protein